MGCGGVIPAGCAAGVDRSAVTGATLLDCERASGVSAANASRVTRSDPFDRCPTGCRPEPKARSHGAV